MKTIGLIGGMSWESTAIYYRIINETVRDTLGGLHSAPILINSLNLAEISALQQAGKWDEASKTLQDAARNLEKAGAHMVLICTNTMHLMAQEVQDAISIPLLHIADATAEALKEKGIDTVGLLGTRYTMEKDFYTGWMKTRHGIDVVIPEADERTEVHHIIFNELCRGRILAPSRQRYVEIAHSLRDKGAEALVLGCTEITLLLKEEDVDFPVFDTTALHATKAAMLSLQDSVPQRLTTPLQNVQKSDVRTAAAV